MNCFSVGRCTLAVYAVLTSSLFVAKTFLRSQQLPSHSNNSQHFVEPEDSLLFSQQPATGQYLLSINLLGLLLLVEYKRITLVLIFLVGCEF